MDLIDRGEYISWKIPKDWHIVLTSNPSNGEYIVNETDEAQKTRFLSMGIKYNERTWAEWAEKNHIDSRCINFMLLNPEVVTGVKDKDNNQRVPANPRQWVNFFHAIGNVGDYQKKENLRKIEVLGQMALGSELIALFISFIHNNMDKLPDPRDMVLDPSIDKVLAMVRDCVGTGSKYRNDIGSVLSIRFANWLINYADSNPIDDKIIKRVHDIVINEVFGADLSYTIAKKVYFKHRQKFVKLISMPTFMKYITVTH